MTNIKRINRKAIVSTIHDNADLQTAIAAALGADVADVKGVVEKWHAALAVKRPSQPSADTLKNRANVAKLVEMVDHEVTAAELARTATDVDGYPMTSRKVGALLANACRAGLIEKSPAKWSVSHYGPIGCEFAEKPTRRKKAKAEEGEK